MLLQEFFSDEDLVRLFLTFQNNRNNFDKIKDKLFPDDQSMKLKQNKRTSLTFFIAVSFIIVVSSSFSIMADHWDSFGALMIIWIVFTIGVICWYILTVKRTQIVYHQNQQFIDKFIQIAEGTDSADEFMSTWSNT